MKSDYEMSLLFDIVAVKEGKGQTNSREDIVGHSG
jgi:hypothetical protein